MTAPPLKGAKRTCSNKRRHPDELTARACAMHAITKYKNTNELWVYRCPTCLGWHLTRCKKHNAMKVTATNPVTRS